MNQETLKDYAEAAAVFVGKENHIDHINIKCGSTTDFEKLRSEFEMQSSYTYQSYIGGRRICIMKFVNPILLGDERQIKFLELSDIKPSRSEETRIDHIEVVPANDGSKDMDEAMGHFANELRNVFGAVVLFEDRGHQKTFDCTMLNGVMIRVSNESVMDKVVREEIMGNESGDQKNI